MPKRKKDVPFEKLPLKTLKRVADPVTYKGKAADAVLSCKDRVAELMPVTGMSGRKLLSGGKRPKVLVMPKSLRDERRNLLRRLTNIGRSIATWEDKVKIYKENGS